MTEKQTPEPLASAVVPIAAPFDRFARWYEAACAQEPNDPNAMALATVDGQGRPHARMLLMKGFGPDGFSFVTNGESDKGREIEGNPWGALLFHWKSLRRQVRIEGVLALLSPTIADGFFAERSRLSQLAAWASEQSRPLADRDSLMARVAEAETRFSGQDVPRPPHWRAYALHARRIEFWSDGEGRLHDRERYDWIAGSGWAVQRLYP